MQPATEATRPTSQQDELRTEVTRLIGSARLKAMRAVRPRETYKDTLIIYALLAAPIAATLVLHAQLGPLVTLACTPLLAFVTGIAFNWINVQIHEASHNLLLPDKAKNDLYCDLVLASLALQDVATYRATHGMHHSYLHSERDPDLWMYTRSVGSPRAVLVGIMEDLSLRSILRRRQQVAEFMRGGPRGPRPGRYVPFAKLAAQLLVLGIFVSGAGLWGLIYYGAVYLYGLLGVFTALVRVRTVVQHYDARLLQQQDPSPMLFTSRTTVASLLQHVVLGARMDYHFEHHLFPNVPYYTLRELHAELERGGFFSALSAKTGQGLRTTDFVRSFVSLATSRG